MRGLVRPTYGAHHVADRRRRRVRPDVGARRSVDAVSGDRHLCERQGPAGRRPSRTPRVDASRHPGRRPLDRLRGSPDAVSLVLLGRVAEGAERRRERGRRVRTGGGAVSTRACAVGSTGATHRARSRRRVSPSSCSAAMFRRQRKDRVAVTRAPPTTYSKLDWTELDDRAVDTVRVLAMDAVQKVGNGHPGTAMSLAPAAYLLFQKLMRHNPADPHWAGPRPVRALVRPLQPHPLHPALPRRATASSSTTSRRCAPGAA